MNMLLISNGSRGDINPFISIGLALQRRGHQVTIISVERYRTVIIAAGLDFISCGPEEDYYDPIHHPDAYSQRLKATFVHIADWLLLGPMRSIYEIIAAFDPKDTVLVASNLMLGARLANERLKFPLVTICLQPFTLWSVEQPPVGLNGISLQKVPSIFRKMIYYLLEIRLFDRYLSPQVNLFRKELGLEEINRICSKWCYSTQKVIGLFPEWFAPPAADWPMHTELAGFVQYDEDSEQPLPPEILQFLDSGSKPILITYGTLIKQAHEFFEHSLAAARSLGYRCLVLALDKEQLPLLNTDNEIYASYIPLNKLLPYCTVVIHGGGIGTISEALAGGIPQLIVPFINDQPDNASRLEKLGLSVTVPIKKYTIATALNSLNRLLNATEIKLNCEKYATKIDFQQAEHDLCVSIEKLMHQGDVV